MKIKLAFVTMLCAISFACTKTDLAPEQKFNIETQEANTAPVDYTVLAEENRLFIEGSIQVHEQMLKTNANVVVYYSLDSNTGRVKATFDPSGVDESVEVGPSMVCKGADMAEIAKCMQEYIDKGICLVTQTCAVCAYEAPCPH